MRCRRIPMPLTDEEKGALTEMSPIDAIHWGLNHVGRLNETKGENMELPQEVCPPGAFPCEDRAIALFTAQSGALRFEKLDLSLWRAAPDLLAALEAAMEAIVYYHEHEGAEEMLASTRAAIAKAKGKENPHVDLQ